MSGNGRSTQTQAVMDIHEGGDVGHREGAAEIFPGSKLCGKGCIVFQNYIFGLEGGAFLPRAHVPDADRLVITSRDEGLAVAAQRHGTDED